MLFAATENRCYAQSCVLILLLLSRGWRPLLLPPKPARPARTCRVWLPPPGGDVRARQRAGAAACRSPARRSRKNRCCCGCRARCPRRWCSTTSGAHIRCFRFTPKPCCKTATWSSSASPAFRSRPMSRGQNPNQHVSASASRRPTTAPATTSTTTCGATKPCCATSKSSPGLRPGT